MKAFDQMTPEQVYELVIDAEDIALIAGSYDSPFRRKLGIWAARQRRDMLAYLRSRGHTFPEVKTPSASS